MLEVKRQLDRTVAVVLLPVSSWSPGLRSAAVVQMCLVLSQNRWWAVTVMVLGPAVVATERLVKSVSVSVTWKAVTVCCWVVLLSGSALVILSPTLMSWMGFVDPSAMSTAVSAAKLLHPTAFRTDEVAA